MKQPNVLAAYSIAGPFDIEAIVIGSSVDEINEIVMGLRTLPPVKDTLTSFVLEEFIPFRQYQLPQ